MNITTSKSFNQSKNCTVKLFFKYTVYGLLALLILFLLYGIEKLLYYLVNFVTYFEILTIVMVVILHVLLLRMIVANILFPVSSNIIRTIIRYENGKLQANNFLRKITHFKAQMELLKANSRLVMTFPNISFRSLSDSISNYSNLFYMIGSRFKNQSDYQKKFSLALTLLGDNMKDSGLDLILEDVMKELEKQGSNVEFRDTSLDKCIKKILLNADILEEYIQDFLMVNPNLRWYSLSNLRGFLKNDTFSSIEQYRVELGNLFSLEELKFSTKDKQKLDVVILKNNLTVPSSKKHLMIICGPNGSPFEMRLHELYLNHGVDVLVWNYQGYGFSTGKTTLANIKDNAEEIFLFAKNTKRWNKIGVHGVSIGGIPACHLAGKNLVDVLIADRTFASIESIALAWHCGPILRFIYSWLFFPSSTNVENYMNCTCYKILLSDPMDTIVRENASLKTAIARFVVQKFFARGKGRDNELEDDLGNSRVNAENAAKLTIGYNNNTRPSFLWQRRNQYKQRGMKCSTTSSILDYTFKPREKNMFISTLIFISNAINQMKLERINNASDKKNSQLKFLLTKNNSKGKYINLQEEYASAGTNDVVCTNEESMSLEKIIEGLNDIFQDTEGSGNVLSRILLIQGSFSKKMFIENFFTNFIVWGCKTMEDEAAALMKYSDTECPKKINELIDKIEQLFRCPEVQQNKLLPLYGKIKILIELLKQFESFLKKTIYKETSSMMLNSHPHEPSSSSNSEELLDHFDRVGKGNLIGLSSGHNGNMTESECKTLINLLEKSGFI